MDKLTLDTNILRDWIWCGGLSDENRYPNQPRMKEYLLPLFLELKRLTKIQRCEIGITTQIYTDCGDTAEITKQKIEELIGVHIEYGTPSISTFPMKFPFIFADMEIIDQIFSVVFPNSKPEDKKYSKNQKDTYQLYAHMVANRDIFLTSDKAILRACQHLKKKFGIIVNDLEPYIRQKK